MNRPRVQWLTKDSSLWEVDWLRFLFSQVQDYIEVEFEADQIKTDENTVLICNHAVPYRSVLDRLRTNQKKYAIVLLSDENLRDSCEWIHDPQCVGLMRNYINPMLLGHPRVNVFGLGYKIGLVKNLQNQPSKDLLWSFAGTLHGERKNIIEKLDVLTPNKVHTCSGFGAVDGLQTKEYTKLLQSSKYVLCPPGQDSMDSFRLYEALEAGSVPVCVRNTGYWHLHPSYWQGVFLGEPTLPFVCEDTWEAAVETLQQIEQTDKYTETQELCQKFWKHWKFIWQQQTTDLFNKLKGP